ncbi:hypothetical protein [Streptomyces monashensis]|uniref:hypothetical protein n=1 Tax=Streptomyces monashensis TaxID=1678012 RepID=UPI0015A4F8A7|nr:hypothetical protein [Streptomyces monashensis]
MPLEGASADAQAFEHGIAAVGDLSVGVQAGGEILSDTQCGFAGPRVKAFADSPAGGSQEVGAPGTAGRSRADLLSNALANQDE